MHSQLMQSVAMLLTLGVGLSAQTQVTISPSKDNTLFEDSTGAVSNGAGSACFAGTTLTGGRRRAVIAFDVAKQIPKGSTITKADLVLTVYVAATISNVTVNLHTLTADWGEGSSVAGSGQGAGGTSQTNDATWVHRFYSTTSWSNAGGDFNGTASGSTSVGSSGAHTWASTKQMVADVQSWLDKPATSFGWLVMGDESSSQTAKGFFTKEDTTATNRPQLVVTYTPPKAQVSSTGVGCMGSATTAMVLSASGLPSLGNKTFALSLNGGPAGNALFGLALSLLKSPLPLGAGCSLYVNTLPILVVFPGNANGALPLPIPNNPSLGATTVYWQAALGDPKTGFLLTSNALTTTIGV